MAGTPDVLSFRRTAARCLKTSYDVPAELWDAQKRMRIRRFIEGVQPEDKGASLAEAAVFSPDGRTLATGGYNYIWLWDVSTGKELRRWKNPFGVRFVAFSQDGRAILTTGLDWDAHLLDVVTFNEIGRLEHESKILSFAVSPDGQTALTAVETDTDARLWDTGAGKMTRRLKAASKSSVLHGWPERGM